MTTTLLAGDGLGDGGVSRLSKPWTPWALYAAAIAVIAVGQVWVDVTTSWSWDEAVYMSQVRPDTITMGFGPTRARGITWLVAPAMLLSASMLVTRCYLLVASATALVLSFRSWRLAVGPTTAALAALIFSTFWSVPYFASAVFPNIWIAFGLVGAIGAMTAILRCGWTRSRALQLAAWTLLAIEMRPPDAVVAIGLAGLVVAWLAFRGGDALGALRLLGTAAAAGAISIIPWTVESFVRFRDPLNRMTSGLDIVNGGQSHHFVLVENVRTTDDLPYTYGLTPDPVDPWVLLWWVAMSIGAVWSISRITRPGPAGLTAPAGVAMVGLVTVYSFITPIDARYLVPAWALGSICIAALASTILESGSESTGDWRRWLRPAAVPLMLVVAAAPFQIANLDEQASERTKVGDQLSSLAETANAYLTTEECSFVMPWGIAQISYATGCRGGRLNDTESGELPTSLRETAQMFVLVPTDVPAPGAFFADWEPAPTEYEPWTLYLRPEG